MGEGKAPTDENRLQIDGTHQCANAYVQKPNSAAGEGRQSTNIVPTERIRSRMAQQRGKMKQLRCVSHQELHTAGKHSGGQFTRKQSQNIKVKGKLCLQ